MTRIGLISDTHGFLDEAVFEHFANCDEVWHAGDFGTIEIADKIRQQKTLKGVYGNIDGQNIRKEFPEQEVFMCEEVKVMMRHIGGYPPKYNPETKKEILIHRPQLFISGHSHILKIMYDDKLNCLHMNPGAAGKQGWQKVRTIIRFVVDGKEIGYLNDLKKINEIAEPNDIESINVIKGEAAIKKYGEKGTNGVIEIITKEKKTGVKEPGLISEVKEEPESRLFTKVEIEAAFPGGEQRWNSYLNKVLDKSIPVKNGAPEGHYTAVIQFVVDTEGYISDVKALSNMGYGMEEEAMRVIKKGPKWVPAVQKGHVVKAYKKQKVDFHVTSE